MRMGHRIVAWLLVVPLVTGPASLSSAREDAAVRPAESYAPLERQVLVSINAYRAAKGLGSLAWNDKIAAQAREHSRDMACGVTAFGHDGFDRRLHVLVKTIAWSGAAENVFMSLNVQDPAAAAVGGWLDSPGHRENIEGDYDLTGVGIARSSNGSLYFTQIFLKSRGTPPDSR
jgi:uncharacterized protein YkwD